MPKTTTKSGAPGQRLGSAKQISSIKPVAPATDEVEAEAGAGESDDDGCGADITITERLGDLDLQALAERVFALMREELRVERQRLGRN